MAQIAPDHRPRRSDRLKESLKDILKQMGLDVRIYRKIPSPLVIHKIDLLLDVGANAGQYAMKARAAGYRNRIVSFEPLSTAHESLEANARSDPSWIIHERCAIGAKDGTGEINISRNSYSSSLLPMLPAHTDAWPESAYIGKMTTKIVPLSSVFDAYRRGAERVFVKIDTQGYESEVLDGAKNCLGSISGIELELSVVPLYLSQQLYDYFFHVLREAGFGLWTLAPGLSDRTTGQVLQFDAIFVRP
jgi:FkbM family methyltransferase